jgi:hypothetical protein
MINYSFSGGDVHVHLGESQNKLVQPFNDHHIGRLYMCNFIVLVSIYEYIHIYYVFKKTFNLVT